MKVRHWLAHKLFDWDYAAWVSGGELHIGRVRMDMCGEIYFQRRTFIRTLDMNSHNFNGNVMWLTCMPEKYIKQSLKLKDLRKSI